MKVERECNSVEATAAMAGLVAGLVRAGDVLAIDGAMGAGKTTFVRALAGAMGLDTAAVSSPTFVMVNEYRGGTGPDLIHVDAYRLGGDEELDLLGWDRLIAADAVLAVEWPQRLDAELARLGDRVARIELFPTGEWSRRVTIEAPWDDRAKAGDPGERRDTVCRVTGRRVPADSPTWPFADERARMADLYGWMSGSYTLSRAIEERDLDEGV